MGQGSHYAKVVTYEMVMRALFSLPRYRVLNSIKSSFLRALGADIGKGVTFYPGVWIAPPSNLYLGDNVDIALGVLMTTSGGIHIGNRTLIGYETHILSSNHKISPRPGRVFDSGHAKSPVWIGDDVWVGSRCTVLPGVSIGDGCVVGAGSVVTKDLPEWTIAVGNPAQVVKLR